MECLDILDATACGVVIAESIADRLQKRHILFGVLIIIAKILGLSLDIGAICYYYYYAVIDEQCAPCDELRDICEYDLCNFGSDEWQQCVDDCITDECSKCSQNIVFFVLLTVLFGMERLPMLFITPIMCICFKDYLNKISDDKVDKICLRGASFNLTEFLCKIVVYNRKGDIQGPEAGHSCLRHFCLDTILPFWNFGFLMISYGIFLWSLELMKNNDASYSLGYHLMGLSLIVSITGISQQLFVLYGGKLYGIVGLACIAILLCAVIMYLGPFLFGW